MRIAIFHNLPSGGAKRALFEWTHRLASRHTIDVYSLKIADHNFCDIRPYTSSHVVFEYTPHPLFKSPLGRLNQFQRWRDLKNLERLNHQIAKQINGGAYDVLFAHPDVFTLIPSLLSDVTVPSVYYLHEPFGASFIRNFDRSYLPTGRWQGKLDRLDPLIWLYKNRLERMRIQSVRKTKLLLSNSEFTRKHIQMSYGVDAPVCHLGVNMNGFYWMPEIKRDDFVLSVGELSPRKGFTFLVRSLAHISLDERPPLKLACNRIDQHEREHVVSLALSNGVKLEILQGLKTDQLRLLYNSARLCVYAPIMEPFGLVPLEAMACGTPVVGVREGGIMESVVHEYTGLLIDRIEDQFGSAIIQLLKNPVLMAEYGKNGREHVLKNWTWEKSAAEIERHLHEVARKLPDVLFQ